jgi:hypothetical protein
MVYSITSYGDRPNEYDAVVGYFRAHFLQVHRKNNLNKRVLYTHLTSVVVSRYKPQPHLQPANVFVFCPGHENDAEYHWKWYTVLYKNVL